VAQATLLSYLQQSGVISEQDATRVQIERTKTPKSEESLIRELGLADN
jgi:hypothetical protein